MVDSADSQYDQNKEETLNTPGVIEKYKQAGKIADGNLLASH